MTIVVLGLRARDVRVDLLRHWNDSSAQRVGAQRIGAYRVGAYRVTLEEHAILQPALAKLIVGFDDRVLSALLSRGAGAQQREWNAPSKTQSPSGAWIDSTGSVHSLPLKDHEPIRVARGQIAAPQGEGRTLALLELRLLAATGSTCRGEFRNQGQL